MSLRRLVWLVSAVVLLDTAFYAAVAPLLPRYTADLGLSKAAAGLLTGAYPAGTLLAALPGGWLATRAGPRATVLVGLGLLSVASLAFGFARDIVLLDGARFVQGVGGACSWAGAMSWLVEASPVDRRGELIGGALGAAIAGELLGPVVGSVAEATGPEWVFGAVPLVAGALAVLAARASAPSGGHGHPAGAAFAALRDPGVVRGMWLVALPSLGFGCLAVLGPLRLDALGATATAVGAAFLLAAALEGGVSPIVGRVSDRRGRLVPVRAGLVAVVPLLLLFTAPGTVVLLIVVIVATAGALGAFWAPAMAMLADAADRVGVRQTYAFAFVNLAWAGGQVGGAAGGGALAKASSDLVPFAVVAALCVATRLAVR